ncbi:MAG: NlpC/P60 family protein [Pseudomonadota bacterium]
MAGAKRDGVQIAGALPVNWWAPYIGTPFGVLPGQLTCWGLVRAVYLDVRGIALPTYGELAADYVRNRGTECFMRGTRVAISRTMMNAAASQVWAEPQAPVETDVVLMSNPRSGSRVVGHVGVLVGKNRVLHIEDASGAVVVPLAHFSVASRVRGFRTYQGPK